MSYQEEAVASVTDFKEGEMKQVSVGETDILLAYHQGQYHAILAHCTHYGAPLVEGALYHGKVICPWHHACFDLKGKQCEPPGLDDLPSFEVRVEDDKIYVKVPDETSDRITPAMASLSESDERVYAVVGGGAAAAYGVEAMRDAGFTGRIVMISAEDEEPYDRPNVSKEYLQDEAPDEWMPLRSPDFYEQHGIERRKAKVTALDTTDQEVELSTGDTLRYNKVLLCTGSEANSLSVPGSDLAGVITLRSMDDSRKIRDKAKDIQQVVVVGSSFIGLEAAMSLQKLDCGVTVVSPEKVPFASRWGEPIGKLIQQLHEESGIRFEMETKVKEFRGNKSIESVVLENGKSLTAKLVVVGIGVHPATKMIRDITLADDGGIAVDEHLRVREDVYAAGDIARFPYQGQPTRIEHWRVACQQGRIAGQNMAGQPTTYQSVPFFWSAQQDAKFRYLGYVEDYDRIIYDGSVEDQEFVAYYVKNTVVKAAIGLNRDQEMAALEHLMNHQQVPTPEEIEAGVDILAQLKG